jgi:phosphatidylserine/phosphatidylglycerophosphate/cardiolipin synthase-like enzyme
MRRVDGRTIWRAWKLVRAAGVDLFAPEAPELLARVPGWSSLRLPGTSGVGQPRVTLLDALRALTLMAGERPEPVGEPQLVGTLPISTPDIQPTRDTVRSLVRQAQRELLVVGFAMTDTDFRELLFRRGLAGVHVTVVGDRVDGGARELLTHWPGRATPLTALEDVRPAEGRARMHAKVIVADRSEALLGSANFTFSGLDKNLELGVRLAGETPSQICRNIEALAADGWLREA